MLSFPYNHNFLRKQVCLVVFLACTYTQVLVAMTSGCAGGEPRGVVNGNLDTIFLNYVNKIYLPKAFNNTVWSIYHVDSKKVNVRVVRNKNSLLIDEILDEGYYFLELKNKQQITVYQQLLFAKKMANPRILLNNDTVLVNYAKAELLHKFELSLRFEEAEAAPLCTLVSYDLIVLPYKQEPLQTRLTRANNFSSDRKIELLNKLSAQSRVFMSDVMVQFSNEKEPRNIGSAFFVIRDTN